MELYLLGVVGAYLLGSIPFGLVVSRIFGTDDPRTHGSHNIGFTNVLRVSGKKVGIFTLIGDLGKGTVATASQDYGFPWLWILVIGFSVILGHVFSIFFRFKGGKGSSHGLRGHYRYSSVDWMASCWCVVRRGIGFSDIPQVELY